MIALAETYGQAQDGTVFVEKEEENAIELLII